MAELRGDEPFDAVFVASDLQALGLLQACHRLGIRVPEDLAVVSFDGIPEAAYTFPPLTTVHQSPEQMGREMVALLLDTMASPDEDRPGLMLPTHLVVRASS